MKLSESILFIHHVAEEENSPIPRLFAALTENFAIERLEMRSFLAYDVGGFRVEKENSEEFLYFLMNTKCLRFIDLCKRLL